MVNQLDSKILSRRRLSIVWFSVLILTLSILAFPNSTLAAYGANLISNADLEQAGTNGNPLDWARGRWGTNLTSFTYPVTGYNSPKGAQVNISSYTSGDAKWYFSDASATPATYYSFSDFFKASTPSYVTARYQLNNGSYSYIDLGTAAASNDWQSFSTVFKTPVNTVAVTIFHLIKAVGTLTLDQFSLKPDSGGDPNSFSQGLVSINFDDGWLSIYQNAIPILNNAGYKSTQFAVVDYLWGDPNYMTAAQFRELQSQGHEINSHSFTHPDLTKISTSTAQYEIQGSRAELLDSDFLPVNSFAYPFGAYNDQTEQMVVQAGYKSGRSTYFGYNFKNTDPYALRVQEVDVSTTLDQVKGYIDQALADKSWLILLFHEVTTSGTTYSTTPTTFSQIINYMKLRSVKVITNNEGLNLMGKL